jgi:putative transposase
VTISWEADGYYVCFSCADIPVEPLPPTGQETGVDVGLASFATLSSGRRIFNPPLALQSRTRTEDSPTPGLAPDER